MLMKGNTSKVFCFFSETVTTGSSLTPHRSTPAYPHGCVLACVSNSIDDNIFWLSYL